MYFVSAGTNSARHLNKLKAPPDSRVGLFPRISGGEEGGTKPLRFRFPYASEGLGTMNRPSLPPSSSGNALYMVKLYSRRSAP